MKYTDGIALFMGKSGDKLGFLLNSFNRNGHTPLFKAFMKQNSEVIPQILQQDTILMYDAKDNDNKTALHEV